jgi:hypothetical protein
MILGLAAPAVLPVVISKLRSRRAEEGAGA